MTINKLKYSIAILLLIFISCRNKTTNTQADGSNEHLDFTANYNNSDYKISYKIILDSIKNCFEVPNDSTFKNRILEVYGCGTYHERFW